MNLGVLYLVFYIFHFAFCVEKRQLLFIPILDALNMASSIQLTEIFSPLRLVSDTISHYLQGVVDHDKSLGIYLSDQLF